MILPTTLSLTAAAIVLNIWLALRIGGLRQKSGIHMGHGDSPLLYARMRAQANFIEQTPITLILLGVVEAAGPAHQGWGGVWLAPLGAIFLLGRIAHAFGMDGNFKPGRAIGMGVGTLAQLVLVVVAVLIALGRL